MSISTTYIIQILVTIIIYSHKQGVSEHLSARGKDESNGNMHTRYVHKQHADNA